MITRTKIDIATVSDGKMHSVESICLNVAMYQSCNSTDNRVEFDMMDVPDINCRFGDAVRVSLDSEIVFIGKLFEISRTSNIFTRHYVFYDESFYLRNVVTYSLPKKGLMKDILTSMLSRYQISVGRFDDNGEEVDNLKFKVVSIIDAFKEISDYVSYMYQKMYVFRSKGGYLEFVDIEKAETRGFRNAYPLVLDFTNEEEISSQTYNEFIFYKADEKPKESSAEPKKAADIKETKVESAEDQLENSEEQKKPAPKKQKRTKEYEFLEPLVPYEEGRINYEIAYGAIGGINAAVIAAKTKPELIKDVDSEKEGYTIGSKIYRLTGEVERWGFLPFTRQVNKMPPESVVNQMANIYRNPVRKASYTVIVFDNLYSPGDKLFIGENEESASVYVIESVTTTFRNECVIQEMQIFSWQKVYDVQKLFVEQKMAELSELNGNSEPKQLSLVEQKSLILKKSTDLDGASLITPSANFEDRTREVLDSGKKQIDKNLNLLEKLESHRDLITE
jgi:hypothetical protein